MSHPFRRSAVLLAALAAACSGRDGAQGNAKPAPGPNVVTSTGTEYAFRIPAQVPAGPTTVQLKSQGTEPQHAMLVRLDQPPASLLGGTSPRNPGATAQFTDFLEPAEHILLCLVPDAGNGKFQLPYGMALPVTVS